MKWAIRYIRSSLSRRMTFWVVVLMTAIFIAAFTLMFSETREVVREEAWNKATKTIEGAVLHIDNTLHGAEVAANNMLVVIEKHLDDPDMMLELSRRMVENNPDLTGCCISFEPDFFKSKGRYFAACSYDDGKTVQTEQVDIEVTAPYGEAPIPVLVMDKPWVQGETLSFTLQPAEGAGEEPINYVGIWVNAVSHGSDPTRSVINEDCNGDHAIWNRTFTADGNTIPQDCDYYLQIVVSGVGYSFTSYSTQLYPASGEQLRLPGDLAEIGPEAFRNTDAQWIVIPATCTSIGANAFYACTNLRYLTVEGENTVLSAEAFGDTDLNIIYGKSGSKAQKFAADNGILFYAVR